VTKKIGWTLVAVGVGAPVLLAGWTAVTRGEGEPPRVRTVRVARRTIGATVKATGVVKPRVGALVKVGSRASGVVARLQVKIGDTVRRGQLLA
jgi:HlyD family secretion protein